MKFEQSLHSPVERPAIGGVHHDPAPPPVRMTMGERFAAASAKKKAEEGGEVIAINNTFEDDRVAEQIRVINEKTDRSAATARDAESLPLAAAEAPVEAAPEAVPEVAVEFAPEKSVEQLEEEERAARAKILIRDAERRRATIGMQRVILDTRSALTQVPDAVSMTVKAERPPLPKIDPMQEIDIPGFGKGMVLSVDPENDVIYFATPDERRRVDGMLVKDEGMSSMRAADFTNVIALTPDQARQYIAAANAKRMFSAPGRASAPQENVVNSPQHPQNRYKIAA